MMHQHRGNFFGESQKAIASALHEAGQTDREIADALTTSVNNIIWWRREAGLPANLSADEQRRADEEAYTPPVKRDASSRKAPAAPCPPPGLRTPAEVQAEYFGAATPPGDNALEVGTAMGSAATVDLEELLTTRLLIQGNSGSGKSHLLRKLLEESAGLVQQIIVDPEGDFVSLAETFGHTVVDASTQTTGRLRSIGGKARQLRGSVVLNLDNMDNEARMEAVAAFLSGLFDAPREHWYPALVIVDEAHLFAPATDTGEDREIRKACQQAMADLMCRGRKRGLAGVIATQRLAKLNKNVAAEASNFLMGRTFLDIDITRAADLLGMDRRQADAIRALERGKFLGLGPAIARRAITIAVGEVMTEGKPGAPTGLVPLPDTKPADVASMLLADDDEEVPLLRVVK